MAYFPFFVDLSGRRGLVIGGGTVALRKIEKLLPYGPALTVAAPEISAEIEQLPGLRLRRCCFSAELLEGMTFAIAATDDRAVNREVAALCQSAGIPVNTVDDREACSFVFPALLKRGELSIGISTGGASPTAAILLKNEIAALLPENIGEVLASLEAFRPVVKAAIPEETDRADCFAELLRAALSRGRGLTQEECGEILSAFLGELKL